MAEEENLVSKSGAKTSYFICTTCDRNNKIEEAVRYCVECQGYCCQSCTDIHNSFPTLKTHALLDVSQGNKADNQQARLPEFPTERCTIHEGKVIDMYCQTHGDVGCSACIAKDHKLCPEDGIYHIPGKIDALFNLDFCKWTRNCLQVKLASMKTVSEATDSKLEQLHEVKYAAIEEVHTLQRALESLITQAVETSKKEIETECRKLEEEILKDKENADNASDALQESDKELEKADGNRAQTFVCSKMVEKKMKEINLTDGNVELSFTAKKLLMRHINSAGGISQILRNTETKDDIYEVKEDKDINIRISSDEETCSSYGCCQIDEVNILVADCNNRKIKRIDLHTMEIVEHCALLAEPFDLTVVNKHVVAIACINPNMIAFVYIDSKMVLFKQVGMTHCCRGITCKDDKLYVTNGKSIVYVYNLSGVLQRTVQYDSEGNNTFSNSVYMAFSNSGRKLFVTNLNDGLVCLDEELNHLSTVKYADLKAVEGICNDGRGNIFVVGKDSNNVVQFDEDGKRFGAIVDDLHGLRKPMSVCYLKEQNRLFVTMAESNVMKMFELK